MGFLAPWFLAGLAAVGLPVYIHLLRQHKSTPMPFSSLMFFEQRTQSSIKHRRLRYLLLLALRMALFILLALAFANPYIMRSGGVDTGERMLVVVVDDSFSMRAAGRLDAARRQAAQILASRPAMQRAQVMALGGELRVLTQQIQDAGELRAAVDSIKGGDGKASFGELARALRSMGQTVKTPIEVHLVSDMQKTALPTAFAELSMPENVSLQLHPVAAKTEPNWAVESVQAPAQVWEPKKTRLQVTVSGYNTPEATRTVSLVVAGKTVASKPAVVPANGRATVEFETLDVPYGFTKCEARIDAADSLAGDDRALFPVERSDPRRVLLIHEERDTRSPLYYRAALAASAEAAFAVDAVSVEQSGGQQPSRYAFVVLADVMSVPETLEREIVKYIRAGGSLLVAAGPITARKQTVPVAGIKVIEAKYYTRSGQRFLAAGEMDPLHASLRRAARWEGVKFYYAVNMDAGDGRVVARLTDRTPLLIDRKMGEGRVLVFTSGLDNLTNDFPLHPIFVPFVEQTARYLSGIEQRGGTRQVASFLELRSAQERGVGVEVIGPDGNRAMTLKEASAAEAFKLDREGYYEVRRANGRHEMVAAVSDRRESNLEVLPAETLALWRGDAPTQGEEKTAQTAAEKRPYPLWWFVMLAMAAVALAESVLASRYLSIGTEQGA